MASHPEESRHQPLPSWRPGPVRDAITGFVTASTTAGSAGFVPVRDRIATFDNDGTLWVERPVLPQAEFLLETWAAEAQENPSLADEQPYKAVVTHDQKFLDGLAVQAPDVMQMVEAALGRTWAGTGPEVFDGQVSEWLKTAKHPRFDVAFTELIYRPMLELFDYLKANEFRVFICSGGGRDFVRVFAEQTYGVLKEDVIGSAAEYEYRDGKLLRTDRILGGFSLGPGKPEHIYARAGRLPALAAGNADVDIEMLEVAGFALLVEHDDAEREYAYTKGAEASLARAEKDGWTVVSMRNDWTTLF